VGGFVVIVEGESDCHTLWSYNLPALGIPGAKAWQPAWANYLSGLDVYVWREPDQAGDEFVKAIAQSIPGAKVLVPPKNFKDISEAHMLGEDVLTVVSTLMASATPAADMDPWQARTLVDAYKPRRTTQATKRKYAIRTSRGA
jgi:hypothetical protein